MKTRWILANLLVLVTASLVQAGGPPPVYIVVDKVLLEQGKSNPGWVQIWGSITRYQKSTDSAGNVTGAYTKPVYGYVYLSLPKTHDDKLSSELKDWQLAAGTGKAVAVGSCGDAGIMLTCPIHSPKETVTQHDAAYTTGYLKMFGSLYAPNDLVHYPEVKALLIFASERK